MAKEGRRLIEDTEVWMASTAAIPDPVLAEVNRLWTIGRAYSSTAHAVNNALQVIGGRAELLAASTVVPPDFANRVEVIRLQSLKAGAAIETLLSYSREAIEPQSTILRDIIDATVSLRAHSLHRSGIKLDVQLEQSDRELRFVRQEFQQLLLNLLLLVEARLEGRPHPRIAISMTVDDRAAHLAVSGSGDAGDPRAERSGEFLGADASLRVARFLAGRLGYELQVTMPTDAIPAFDLTIPFPRTADAG